MPLSINNFEIYLIHLDLIPNISYSRYIYWFIIKQSKKSGKNLQKEAGGEDSIIWLILWEVLVMAGNEAAFKRG